jgi:hypothetical protein
MFPSGTPPNPWKCGHCTDGSDLIGDQNSNNFNTAAASIVPNFENVHLIDSRLSSGESHKQGKQHAANEQIFPGPSEVSWASPDEYCDDMDNISRERSRETEIQDTSNGTNGFIVRASPNRLRPSKHNKWQENNDCIKTGLSN